MRRGAEIHFLILIMQTISSSMELRSMATYIINTKIKILCLQNIGCVIHILLARVFVYAKLFKTRLHNGNPNQRALKGDLFILRIF